MKRKMSKWDGILNSEFQEEKLPLRYSHVTELFESFIGHPLNGRLLPYSIDTSMLWAIPDRPLLVEEISTTMMLMGYWRRFPAYARGGWVVYCDSLGNRYKCWMGVRVAQRLFRVEDFFELPIIPFQKKPIQKHKSRSKAKDVEK